MMQPVKNTQTKSQHDWFKIGLKIVYAISLSIYAYYLIDGLGFYQLPFQERPHHEAYRNLRSAGLRGHGFGVIGSVMMTLMLLYSVRKRTNWFGKWGALSRWLDVHIYLGIMGPLLVILHTTFKLNGIVAVSFWSMIAVSGSGILGRYLYLQIPRNRRGDELSLKEIESLDQEFSEELTRELGLKNGKLARLQEIAGVQNVNKDAGLFSLLLGMLRFDLFSFFRKYRQQRMLRKEFQLDSQQLKAAIEILHRKQLLERRILLLNHVQRLFHYWHVFHKPFAILMFLIMILHIGVAVWLGYTWIF